MEAAITCERYRELELQVGDHVSIAPAPRRHARPRFLRLTAGREARRQPRLYRAGDRKGAVGMMMSKLLHLFQYAQILLDFRPARDPLHFRLAHPEVQVRQRGVLPPDAKLKESLGGRLAVCALFDSEGESQQL